MYSEAFEEFLDEMIEDEQDDYPCEQDYIDALEWES